MATSTVHKGWLYKHGAGILGAVYNEQAFAGAVAHGANTALDGLLRGTPVTPALAVDSMVLSNLVNNGDILIAASNGSNSQAWLWVDSSAGTMTLYAAGVEQLQTALGNFVVNEPGADINFRVETDGIQYAIYSDGGKNALVLGSNTDTSSVDQLITVSRAARSSTSATNYYDLRVAPAGAVTTSGVTAIVATVSLAEPNITVGGGSVTNATTLHIASQPTEGGTTNSAIFFGAAANIACTTSLTFNEDSDDIDFRFEGANNANALVIDGGTDSLALGRAVVAGAFLAVDGSSVNRAGVTAVGRHVHIPAVTITQTNANPTTLAIGAGVYVGIPTFDGANAGQTLTDSASVYIAGEPAAGSGNMTLTRVYSLWVDAGTTALDGRTIVGGNLAAPIHDINVATLVAFNEQGSDIDLRIESDSNPNAFLIDAGTDSIGLGNGVTSGAFLTIAGDVNGRTYVTSVGGETHYPAVNFTVQNGASTVAVGARIYVGSTTLTAAAAVTFTDYANLFVSGTVSAGGAGPAAVTTGYAIWSAGRTRIDGDLKMDNAGYDILMKAATAAALEISDGTTKFLAFDTRVATAGVTTIAFDISDYTFASAATNVATGVSLAAHTLNYTGNTQVTSEVITASLLGRTIAGDTATLTVDKATTLRLVAPIEGANVLIAEAAALRIGTATGSPTTQFGIFIEALANGGTNRAIYLAGANGIQFAAADDIIIPANTAAALEISNDITKLLVFDTRNTVTVQNLLIDAPASQTLPDGATSKWQNMVIAAHTVTLQGTTQVTTVNQGAQLTILAPTYNQAGGAVTVDQVSTVHIAAPVAGASVTITANRMISTSVADCYLTGAGVWTDTVCTAKYKQGIHDLDMSVMPSLLEQIRPVAFKYDKKKRGEDDFNRQRYGVVAEELPEFLLPPGATTKSVMNGTVLGAFGLVAIRYLYEQNKLLQSKLASLGV